MLRKFCFTFIVAGLFIAAGSVAVSAQFAQLNGKVELEKADGTKEPVIGALVEAYRTDIKGVYPSSKTNKKGEFAFAAMPFAAIYALSVSCPGCAPLVFPGVKVGVQDNVVITLSVGDGKRLTEDEARKALADSIASGNMGGGEMTEEQKADAKKLQAEFLKKNEAIKEKNRKIQEGDDLARKSNEAGNTALKAEDWDTAIARYDEGVAAVPDFIGSTPILIKGKMAALKGKGFKIYRDAKALPDAEARKAQYVEANKSYDMALAAFAQAIEVYKTAEATTDSAEQKRRDALKLELYALATELHRLKAAGGVDTSKVSDAYSIITDYIAMEPDPAKKLTAQMNLADIMRITGDLEKAVAAYRKVLEMKPDNADAMGSLGLSLFAQGVASTPENKEMEQEGLNYMQKYTELAPVASTDSQQVQELKRSVKESVDYLKAQKMAPQKVPSTPKKKP